MAQASIHATSQSRPASSWQATPGGTRTQRSRAARGFRGSKILRDLEVANDRQPAGGPVSELPGVGATGAILVAQIPGVRGRIDHADAVLAKATPVARHRQPAGGPVSELP